MDVLEVVGTCEKQIFGLSPAERMRRQLKGTRVARSGQERERMGVAIRACAVLDDAALTWLLEHPGTVLASSEGTPLAVGTTPEDMASARTLLEGKGSAGVRMPTRRFVRKLRRQVEVLAVSLDEQPVGATERKLYRNVYKGVTDVITKYLWPEPAYHATRMCARLGISPNMVTSVGVVLMLVATALFYVGEIGWGLLAAWTMTFLDTVDGKLARVTATSSRFGNLLDHGTDILHPPLWWWAVTVGLSALDPGAGYDIWVGLWVILSTYVLSRVLEEGFKKRFGFNAFIWTRFDSRFRMIVSRRNIILLFLTAGLVTGLLTQSWFLAALWSVVSVVIQGWRFLVAERMARKEPLRSWLA